MFGDRVIGINTVLLAIKLLRFIRRRRTDKVVETAVCRVYPTGCVQAQDVRRILVRGVNAPLPPEAKKILKI